MTCLQVCVILARYIITHLAKTPVFDNNTFGCGYAALGLMQRTLSLPNWQSPRQSPMAVWQISDSLFNYIDFLSIIPI